MSIYQVQLVPNLDKQPHDAPIHLKQRRLDEKGNTAYQGLTHMFLTPAEAEQVASRLLQMVKKFRAKG
jgi:hypothetical protein